MKKYRISNRVSGTDFGTYKGSTVTGALNALAKDTGYKTLTDMLQAMGGSRKDLVVEEVKASLQTFRRKKAPKKEKGISVELLGTNGDAFDWDIFAHFPSGPIKVKTIKAKTKKDAEKRAKVFMKQYFT